MVFLFFFDFFVAFSCYVIRWTRSGSQTQCGVVYSFTTTTTLHCLFNMMIQRVVCTALWQLMISSKSPKQIVFFGLFDSRLFAMFTQFHNDHSLPLLSAVRSSGTAWQSLWTSWLVARALRNHKRINMCNELSPGCYVIKEAPAND